MASVNKAIIIGNLGKDPEVRYTSDGNAVANFSVATTDRYKDRDGNMQEKTEWHRVVVFGKTAENCGQYLSKGRSVYVEGPIQTRSWDDREGNKRYTTEIVGRTVQFLTPRGEAGGRRNMPTETPAGDYSNEGEGGLIDDDVPF